MSIRSSVSELNNFRNSLVAKDLKRELNLWALNVRDMYPKVDNLLDKGRIDGRLEAIMYVLNLVDVMIESRKEQDSHINKVEDLDDERGFEQTD